MFSWLVSCDLINQLFHDGDLHHKGVKLATFLFSSLNKNVENCYNYSSGKTFRLKMHSTCSFDSVQTTFFTSFIDFYVMKTYLIKINCRSGNKIRYHVNYTVNIFSNMPTSAVKCNLKCFLKKVAWYLSVAKKIWFKSFYKSRNKVY